jgi:hypothetical protein
MARLPGLIRALALHDRRGEKTIAHIARQVRDAGLISSTKRGVGASSMTFADAATLLLAVCGDSSPQGAVVAVGNLRSLEPRPWDTVDALKREDLPERLEFLRGKMSFSETVERLIAHAPAIASWQSEYVSGEEPQESAASEAEYSMQRMVGKLAGFGPASAGYARLVRVVCYVPGVAAEVHLGRPWRQLEEDDAFHEYYAAPDGWNVSASGEDDASDCLITIEVGLPILLALHNAVVGEGET